MLIGSQHPCDTCELLIQGNLIGELPGNNERSTCLVDQDRVDLVNNRVVVTPLNHGIQGARHVVAQVVKTHFVVRAVGDVARIVVAFDLGIALTGHDETDAESQPAVQLSHPVGISFSEIVVDGDEVNTFSTQGIEVCGQGRDQGLALTGSHLGDPTEVQRCAAHELDVVVTLPKHAQRAFAHNRKRLGEQLSERFTPFDPIFELGRLGLQFFVG